MKKGNAFLVPFWEKEEEDDHRWWKNIYIRKISLIIKWIIYSFSGFMILWSTIQTVAAPYTTYDPRPGHGFEFGYHPVYESTKDIRFDLGSWSILGPGYHAFYEPTVVYGPFLSWFVYPIARIFLSLIYAFDKYPILKNTGMNVICAMIIVMFVMRFVNFWPTLRSSIYMEKQMSHQKYIDAINAKYNKYDMSDKKMKLQKHQELSKYNKKHKLKPFVVFENFFVSTPIFLIIFKVITISRPIKFTYLFNTWELSKTPSTMIFNHLTEDGWKYLILCFIIIPVNFLSQKINTILSRIRNPYLKKKQNNDKNSSMAKMSNIQKFMTIAFLLFTFFWSTSLAIYYFFNSIFTIFQNLLIHYILVQRNRRTNRAQIKLQELGLNV